MLLPSVSLANEIVNTTAGARATAAGGIALLADDPLAAMSQNPAMLNGMDSSFQLSARLLTAAGEYTSSLSESDVAERGPGLLPEFGFVRPLENSNITVGGVVYGRSAIRAHFDFQDPPGTLGVSYGRQRHLSEHVVVEASFGASLEVSERFTIGASLGLLYNRNLLNAPYIFQSHPALRGLKVLVDLEAEDIAETATIGAQFALTDAASMTLAYTWQSDFNAKGNLSGDLSGLGLGFQPNFDYRARVETASPAVISAGFSWDVSARLRVGMQLEHINWSRAFDDLPITLTRGSNAELNDFLDSDSIQDTAPLDWNDQTGIQFGFRYALTPRSSLLAGLALDDTPVPEATFTPMTGAVMDRSFSLGFSRILDSRNFGRRRFNGGSLDIAYRISWGPQYDVDTSRLAGGEYTGSSLELTVHSLILSFGF